VTLTHCFYPNISCQQPKIYANPYLGIRFPFAGNSHHIDSFKLFLFLPAVTGIKLDII
jgi:hypothetical protein